MDKETEPPDPLSGSHKGNPISTTDSFYERCTAVCTAKEPHLVDSITEREKLSPHELEILSDPELVPCHFIKRSPLKNEEGCPDLNHNCIHKGKDWRECEEAQIYLEIIEQQNPPSTYR